MTLLAIGDLIPCFETSTGCYVAGAGVIVTGFAKVERNDLVREDPMIYPIGMGINFRCAGQRGLSKSLDEYRNITDVFAGQEVPGFLG